MKPRSFSVRRKSDLNSDMACLSCRDALGGMLAAGDNFPADRRAFSTVSPHNHFKSDSGADGMTGLRTAIGLMSGTSLDGIDVALLRTDGEAVVERGPFLARPYDAAFRRRLQGALETAKGIGKRDERPGDLAAVERAL